MFIYSPFLTNYKFLLKIKLQNSKLIYLNLIHVIVEQGCVNFLKLQSKNKK